MAVQSRYLLINCVGTYVQLDPDQEKELRRKMTTPRQRDILEIYDSGITWADRKREETLEKVRRDGRVEGRILGQRDLILRLLERRFGAPPTALCEKVEALASPEALEDLAERILTAGSLDDLGL